jgi:phage terminase large subunit-like protein
MERLVLSKEIAHDGNPLLRWAMSNVVLKIDAAGNSKPDKAHSKERIDPVVASLMALERCSMVHSVGVGQISWAA